MKKILLWLIRLELKKNSFNGRRKFRLDLCKEIHNYYQNEVNAQTTFGRFYWAVGAMIEAGPEYIIINEDFDVKGGIESEFIEIKERIRNKPRRNKLKRILGK